MKEQIVHALDAAFSAPVATVLIATLPILELRGSLPYACTLGDLPLWQAYVLSVVGNMLPIPFVIWFLEPVTNLIRRCKPGDRFVEWLFARTRRKGEKIQKYEALGLAIFVAVPLPMTGAWSGAIAGHVFGVKPMRTFWACFAGVCGAGVIVSVATVGVEGIFSLVFGK